MGGKNISGIFVLLWCTTALAAQTNDPDLQVDCTVPSNAGLPVCTGLPENLPITNFAPLIAPLVGGFAVAGALTAGTAGNTAGTVSTTSTTSTD